MIYSVDFQWKGTWCGHIHRAIPSATRCGTETGLGGISVMAYRFVGAPEDHRVTLFEIHGDDADVFCELCRDVGEFESIGDRKVKCNCAERVEALVPAAPSRGERRRLRRATMMPGEGFGAVNRR